VAERHIKAPPVTATSTLEVSPTLLSRIADPNRFAEHQMRAEGAMFHVAGDADNL